ncbi:type II toxin-antitoxin system RelE/ParE family toxin [Mucilaginibacter mali]|uniref:Type II toxin-antitoxin system RelE/ParE family toxin n=1 Tax=Mucilaginibacter mali TaxID=2740462 RepID=A0A7D4PWA7_9SPHI|nr:type II toxin-antitoxin system RelE/ParE family toxin [Mucilaginibacter mali]QKJ32248.1 type II toxin-antitoxin system RelE/ParE family toxin [Mucilaginibacter mali]
MAKRIVFSEKSFRDINRIVEFNNRRNLSDRYSKAFVKGLNKRLKLLLKQPQSGIATDAENTLLLIGDQYYIFYMYDELVIEIKSIYHQKENVR